MTAKKNSMYSSIIKSCRPNPIPLLSLRTQLHYCHNCVTAVNMALCKTVPKLLVKVQVLQYAARILCTVYTITSALVVISALSAPMSQIILSC